ncbi:MAG TPA: ferric reductase-like transmembrane domain-containing protein [Amnibacterium sp.]|jgi:sulfoxide reductase heme-binding subunit YedZ|uniref:ferric reductase-like transmembrane domain-containing protein n=1 Tax=Amnibacterium sp. TaxID=1872496 RepID=UPI002F945C76
MSEAFWALGRGSGVVLLALLTVSVLLGLLTRSGRPIGRLPRFGVTLVHRNVALLSVVFLAVHVLSLLGDPYAQLRLVDLVVPFAGAQSPFWLGLGTLALDLMLAVTITALLRRWIGQRVFRAVHWATYPLWSIALAHGLGQGSDARSTWFLAGAAVAAVCVLSAAIWRTSVGFVEHRRHRLEPVR